MTSIKDSVLKVNSVVTAQGITLSVGGKKFATTFPKAVWQKTPAALKKFLQDNLVFGDTHFLPLLYGNTTIKYSTRLPFLESFLFRNQLNDLIRCEKADGVPPQTYIKNFYNLEFSFAEGESIGPEFSKKQFKKNKRPTAVIPFTFGKESLLTFALCRELGIKPVLVYSQEPSQPHEEAYKKKKLLEFGKKFGVDTYFIKHEPGLFRYDMAFKENVNRELGWGTQTTMLALQMIPFVYAYGAEYVLFGSEFANNEVLMSDEGWKLFISCDQTYFWTEQQNNMVRLLTEGQCHVRASLQSMQELNILYILHHRYPEIGKYQFSCLAENPLYKGSQWCHVCYKCSRIFLYASAVGIDPFTIGFKKDLLNEPGMFENYLGKVFKTQYTTELDFCFYILAKRGIKSRYVEQFKKEKLPHLKAWDFYYEEFTTLHEGPNLPEAYKSALTKIFSAEMKSLKKVIQ